MSRRLAHILKAVIPVASALCLAVAAGAVWSDIVMLKSGSVLRGEVVKEDDETVTLRLTYGTLHIKRSHVKSVQKEGGLKTFLEQAKAREDADDIEGAIRILEKAFARFPDSASVRGRLVALYRRRAATLKEQGDAAGLRRVYRRILELSPDDAEASSWLKLAKEVGRKGPERLKEARLLLRLERYRETLDRLRKLVAQGAITEEEVRKDLAEAHVGYGRRLLELGRFGAARDHYQKGVRLNPDLFDPYRHEIMVSRLSPIVDEINRKGNAIPKTRWEVLAAELEAVVGLEKDNFQSRYALAVAYTHLGRYPDAARIFGGLVGEEPDYDNLEDSLSRLIKKAEVKIKASPIPLVFNRNRFTTVRPGKAQVLETTHFVIHHHNDELALLVARGAEYYLKRNYESLLGRMPAKPWSKKCDIYLFPSREAYLKRSRQAPWSPAMAGTSAIGGRLTGHHIMTCQTVADLLSSHLSHEITHIIHSAIVDYSGSIPLWFREGLAVKMEPWYKHLRMARVLRDARTQKNVFSFKELTAQGSYPGEDRVDVFYAQSYALTNAIYRSGTREQFARVCRELLDKDVVEACRNVYGLDRDDLLRRWETHQAELISLLDTP